MSEDDDETTHDPPAAHRGRPPGQRPEPRRLNSRGYRWRVELSEAEIERARRLLDAERSFAAVAADLGVVPRVLARHFPSVDGQGQTGRRQRPKLIDNGGHSLKADIAAQIAAAMREDGISQRAFAALIGKTSGAVQNLLNPETNVTLANLARTAAALGLELRVELRRVSGSGGDRPAAGPD